MRAAHAERALQTQGFHQRPRRNGLANLCSLPLSLALCLAQWCLPSKTQQSPRKTRGGEESQGNKIEKERVQIYKPLQERGRESCRRKVLFSGPPGAGCSFASVRAELLPSLTHFPRRAGEGAGTQPARECKETHTAAAAARSLPPPSCFSLQTLPSARTSPAPRGFQQPLHVIPSRPPSGLAPRFAQLPPSAAARLGESPMRL